MVAFNHHPQREEACRIVRIVERVRSEFPKTGVRNVDLRMINRLSELLAECRSWLAQQLREQLADYSRKVGTPLRVAYVPLDESERFYFMIAFVRPSKAEHAYFEAAMFEVVPLPHPLRHRYPSIAKSIRLHVATKGLQSPDLLGLFPEHFGSGGQHQQAFPDAEAYYIVDRFERRFRRHTMPVVDRLTTPWSFGELKWSMQHEWSSQQIEAAASNWLLRHEYYHSSGPLQLHKFLRVKSNRYTAGLEETRVDLRSILSLKADRSSAKRTAVSIAQYILAERLFAYPLVDLDKQAENPTFDTIGSQFLLLRMLELEGLSLEGEQLNLLPNWIGVIQQIVDSIHCFEGSLVGLSEQEMKRRLTQFVREDVEGRMADLPRRAMKGGFPLLVLYYDMYEKSQDSFDSGTSFDTT